MTDEPAESEPTARRLKFFWIQVPDGPKLTHLDFTGAEVLALEARLGCEWGDQHPITSMSHRMAWIETFLARTDKAGAAARVGALTVKELDDALDIEWDKPDDLPDAYEDGLPLAGKAES